MSDDAIERARERITLGCRPTREDGATLLAAYDAQAGRIARLEAVRDAAREVLAGLDGDGTLSCALCGREGEHSDGGDCNVLEIALALCDAAEAKGGET